MTQYDTNVLALGADGYWKLDEASGLVFTDSSAGGNSLTAPGACAEAYRFPGPSPTEIPRAVDFISTNPPLAAIGTLGQRAIGASFTCEAWFGGVGTIPTAFGLITKGYNTVEQRPWYSLGIETNGKAFWFFRNVAGTDYRINSLGPINDATYTIQGPYHHVVGTYTPGTADMYVDGILQGSLAVPNTGWGTGVQPLCLGRISTGVWGGPWLAAVAIYPGQLSAAQVAANYALGSIGSAWTVPQLAGRLDQLSVDLSAILACVRKVF